MTASLVAFLLVLLPSSGSAEEGAFERRLRALEISAKSGTLDLSRLREKLPFILSAAGAQSEREEVFKFANSYCRKKRENTTSCAQAVGETFMGHAEALGAKTPDESRLKGTYFLEAALIFAIQRRAHKEAIRKTCRSALEQSLDPLQASRAYRLWAAAIEPDDGASAAQRAAYRDEVLKLKFASLKRVLDGMRDAAQPRLGDERQILMQEIAWIFANPPTGVTASPEAFMSASAAALGSRHAQEAGKLGEMLRVELAIVERRKDSGRYKMRSPQESMPAEPDYALPQ